MKYYKIKAEGELRLMITTTNSAINLAQTVTQTYVDKGFLITAGLIILLISVLFIGIFTLIIKKIISDSKIDREDNKNILLSERNQNKDMQDKLLNMFQDNMTNQQKSIIEMNVNIINEIKSISTSMKEGIDRMSDIANKSSEVLFSVIESSNDKILKIIDGDKLITINEFEKQSKMAMQVALYRINDGILNRIERNSLYELKHQICGTELYQYKDSEIFSLIKKFVLESKEDVKYLNYKNENLKYKIFEIYDNMITEMTIELCRLFDVPQEYDRRTLTRSARNITYKILNQIQELDFENI